MRTLKRVLIVIDKISEWSGLIFAPIALILTAVLMYTVIMRFGFNDPPIWGTDISIILFSAYIVSGGAYTLLHKGHVRLDLFFEKLSLRGRAIFDASTAFVFFFFIGIIFYGTFADCMFSTFVIQRTTGSYFDAPLWPGMWVLPLAAILLGFQGLAKFIRDLYFAVTGSELEAKEANQ